MFQKYSRKKLKDSGINVLILIATSLIMLGAMEILFRITMEAPQSVRLMNNEENEAVKKGLAAVQDQGVFTMTANGRRMKPNLDAVLQNHKLSKKDIRIQTNSLGYREDELGEKTRPRFLFLGDSVTNQTFLPREKTWVHQLEELAAKNNRNINMINAGVASISLQDEYAILHETGLSIQPDVVVIAFYLNDFIPSNAVKITNPPSFLQWSYLARYTATTLSVLEYKFSKSWDPTGDFFNEVQVYAKETTQNLKTDMDINPDLKKKISGAQIDWAMAWSDSSWDKYKLMLEQFKRTANQNGFQLAVVMFPVKAQIEHPEGKDSNYPQRRAREITESLGIPFHDTLPAHKKAFHENKNKDLFFDHCHHTAYGSQIVSDDIYPFLTQLFPE